MNKPAIISFVLLLFSSNDIIAQSPLIINTNARNVTLLNGKWHYIIDPYENGYYDYRYQPHDEHDGGGSGYYKNQKAQNKTDLIEYDFDLSPTMLVPGDWNSQEEKLLYYEGSVWYKKSFDYAKSNNQNRVFVYFGAANYESDVYLNGKKLGKHIGGFTPFNFEITDLLKEKDNFIILKVDNKRTKEGVPTLNTDWWNYGGITRDVKIIETPATFIRDYFIQLDPANPQQIKGYVQLDGKISVNKEIKVSIPEIGLSTTVTSNNQGRADIDFTAKKLKRWSLEEPKLYAIKVSIDKNEVTDKIGFRTIETRGADILLNGKSVFMKGICIHEENVMRGGRSYSEEDARMVFGWVKELHANYARLAHYPHNEYMARVADEMGILLWEEIPVYWTIDWKNEKTYANAKNQLTEMITRDKNRASVVVWSMGNETPVTPERTVFMSNLIKEAKSLDNTRLISAALEQHARDGNWNVREIGDPLADQVDVLSFNQYVGWYDGLPDKCENVTWEIEQQKPVLISEFGAGALQGQHGDSLTRWTEEYQEYLYRETIKMLSKIPQLRGMTPWILTDFRSPRRPLPLIQDGYNRKGLVSQTGDKKKAFYVLRDFYMTK